MNEQTETMDESMSPAQVQTLEVPCAPLRPEDRIREAVVPQAGCSTCGSGANGGASSAGAAAMSFIYAIGHVETRFPNLGVEKEFAQAIARTETEGMTDQQAFHAVLSARENRYLARQLCWVLSIQGLDTYLLLPRDPADIELLIESIRPVPSPNDLDVIIGTRGPIASPEYCNGLTLPFAVLDQMYSFDRDTLIQAIPRPERATAAQFAPAAEELFARIMQLTDNAGATNEHRALNYLVMRYPAIYAKVAEQFSHDFSLSRVDVRHSSLSATRNMVDVIFAFTNRNTDYTEKFYVRVDVTEEFPFLVTKLSPFYNRDIGGVE